MAYRGACDKKMTIVEMGGQKVGVYHRSPTPGEYISYHQEKIRLKNGKVESNLAESNMKFGLKVIVGVRPGDLEYRENGAWKALDTDLLAEEEWRAILARDFFELVDFVGARVFNPATDVDAGRETEEKKS